MTAQRYFVHEETEKRKRVYRLGTIGVVHSEVTTRWMRVRSKDPEDVDLRGGMSPQRPLAVRGDITHRASAVYRVNLHRPITVTSRGQRFRMESMSFSSSGRT